MYYNYSRMTARYPCRPGMLVRRPLRMDIRCKTCSKLFRIADEKIAGKGIRFKCSQCGDSITILKEDLERDRLARETAAGASSIGPEPQPQPQTKAQPQPMAPPAPPAPSVSQPQPAAASAQTAAVEQKATTTPQHTVSTGLEDFDFSAPHDAAASAEQSAESSRADPFADLKAEGGQDAGGEITISAEEEKAAEEALQFPADIISEPKHSASFDAAAEEPMQGTAVPPDVGSSVPSGGPQESAHKQFGEEPVPQATRTATQPSAPKTPVKPEPEADSELAAAPAAPGGRKKAGAERPLPASAGGSETGIHPFASGSATGAVAGLLCGIPLGLLVLFGFGMLAKLVPALSSLPVVHLAAAAGAAVVGMGVMIGLAVAAVQAAAGRKLFFLVNILIGTMAGAAIGIGVHVLTSLALGKGVHVASVIARSASWTVVTFLLSVVLVVTRRLMVHAKEESFAEPLGGLQKTWLALSLLAVLASLYADGVLTGRMDKLSHDAARQIQQISQQLTPDGLTVVNAAGHIDPASGDLVITGTVRNDLDRQKPGWFLVVEVTDKEQKVITRMKMLNGVQAYAKRDFEVLEKRGVKVEDQMRRFLGAATGSPGGALPPKGAVSFEMRLPEPPANAAGFLPLLKPFDPAVMLKEFAADWKN
jgi:predicted Zn finger-like uncharacterized protein